jgi:SAM-dependent methyltransferase
MADLPPSTSQQIADVCALEERYVREWLGAMVAGSLIGHDEQSGTYVLPSEHAALLTRAAGPDNLAAFADMLPMLASVEDDVVDAFRNGGGVPYSKFPAFQQLMADQSAMVFDAALVEGIVPLVDGLRDRLDSGIDVADIGCGSGHAINLLAEAFPASAFTGYDFSDEGIAAGRAEAEAKGLTNTHFEVCDVSTLAGPARFDFVTAFDSVHDQAKPAAVLKGIYDVLRPGGVFLCVDVQASSHVHDNIDHPLGPMLYTVSTMHCMTVSLALGGDGLGTVWGTQVAQQMMHDAGFSQIDVRTVEADILNAYYIATKT